MDRDDPSGNTLIQNYSVNSSNGFASPISRLSSTSKMSPAMYRTPVRPRRLSKICEGEIYSPVWTQHTSTAVSFLNLPLHTTPPSRLGKFVITNPFDESTRKRLHLPFVSPTLFANVVSPSKKNHEFSWTIEDLASLKPADIDEFQDQYGEATDLDTEKEAQDNIDRFFASNPIVSSPWSALGVQGLSSAQKCTPDTPIVPRLDMSLDDEDSRCSTPRLVRREAWTQTVLALPPDVAPSLQSVLGSCSISTQDDGSVMDMSVSISRQASPMRSSSFHGWGSPMPNHDNLLSSTIHTPLNVAACRTFGTPLPRCSMLSPIGVSPIMHKMYREPMEWSDISADSLLTDTWSQTELSLPQMLPGMVETSLKPYLTFTQDQSELEEVNLNSSLSRRRKLLFHDSDDDLDMSTTSVDNGYNTS